MTIKDDAKRERTKSYNTFFFLKCHALDLLACTDSQLNNLEMLNTSFPVAGWMGYQPITGPLPTPHSKQKLSFDEAVTC
jgi:hypothetical protein